MLEKALGFAGASLVTFRGLELGSRPPRSGAGSAELAASPQASPRVGGSASGRNLSEVSVGGELVRCDRLQEVTQLAPGKDAADEPPLRSR